MNTIEIRTRAREEFVDLTADPEMPSIFDPDRRSERTCIKFLRNFRAEIAASAAPNGGDPIAVMPCAGKPVARDLATLECPPQSRLHGRSAPSAKQAGAPLEFNL